MTEKLEQGVWELDVVKQCKELVETGEWYETRTLLHTLAALLVQSLTLVWPNPGQNPTTRTSFGT
jgi:hypothetical protein